MEELSERAVKIKVNESIQAQFVSICKPIQSLSNRNEPYGFSSKNSKKL